MMQLKPGMRVLDVGCGVGGPAREIARFSDATIVGVNNNDFQIGRATAKSKKAGLSDKVSFVKGDFMKLSEQFGENSFDAGRLLFILPIFFHGANKPKSMPLRPPATPLILRASTAKFSSA